MNPPPSTPRLLLASRSPRRRELLGRLGIAFSVAPPALDEDTAPRDGEAPEQFALRLAMDKAQAVAGEHPGALALGADTIVVLDADVLGKPASLREAVAMLRRLRGRSHRVITAVALARARPRMQLAAHTESLVRFRDYSDAEIETYVASGDPMDKAGAYAIQSDAFRPAAEVRGCLLSVVGLPCCLVAELLGQAGLQASPTPGFTVPGPCRRRPGGCSLAGSAPLPPLLAGED